MIDLFFKASTPVSVAIGKPLTNIVESTIRLAFANSVSVIVVFPFTYNEESIVAINLFTFKFILLDNDRVSTFNLSLISFKVAIVPTVPVILFEDIFVK